MITSVVTNGVAVCLEVITTTIVPIPCPDGIDGCCVAHSKSETTRRYIPLDHGIGTPVGEVERGVCLRPCLAEEILETANTFGCGDIIPVCLYDCYNGLVIKYKDRFPIGFIYKKSLEAVVHKYHEAHRAYIEKTTKKDS